MKRDINVCKDVGSVRSSRAVRRHDCFTVGIKRSRYAEVLLQPSFSLRSLDCDVYIRKFLHVNVVIVLSSGTNMVP